MNQNKIVIIHSLSRYSKILFYNKIYSLQDLEKRLATVLRQSFQQCPTIGAQLRLLEVFEGVSGREMVQEYLKDKDKQLINSFTDELIAVRSMFIAKMNSPPLHINLPPIVSCMTWIRALQRRIKVSSLVTLKLCARK